jgi:3-methyladenine DNA glycosylase AlkD
MNADEIASLLKEKECPESAKIVKRYMRSNLDFLGLKADPCQRIAKMVYKENKDKIPFNLIDNLWKSNVFEEKNTALYLLERYKKIYDEKVWKYVNGMVSGVENWGHCDQMCKLRGEFWERDDFLDTMREWTKSKNLWKRRSAVVSLIARRPVRIPFEFEAAMTVLEPLVYDDEYYVQKGVGWIMRMLYQQYPKKTFNYLMKHKDMPRVALRTACEKMSSEEKDKVMKK